MRDLGIVLAITYTTLLLGLALYQPYTSGVEPDVYSRKSGWPKFNYTTEGGRCCVKKGESKCLPC